MFQEKFEDAIKECTKALELNPSYMKALTRRAEAHEKLEHFEEALAGTFRSKSCAFDPLLSVLHFHLISV